MDLNWWRIMSSKLGIISQVLSINSLWTLPFDDSDLQTGSFGFTDVLTVPETVDIHYEFGEILGNGNPFAGQAVTIRISVDGSPTTVYDNLNGDYGLSPISFTANDTIAIEVVLSGSGHSASGTIILKINDTNGRLLTTPEVSFNLSI